MIDYTIEIHESIPSSNNLVKRAIETGTDEGLVVCAYEQTAGYGRLGRSWVSRFGGSYFSLLLRPKVRLSELATISHVTAVAMYRALSSLVIPEEREHIKIKWPNDIVYYNAKDQGMMDVLSENGARRFRKLSGISLERHAGGTCIGIGTNVFIPFGQEDVGGKNIPLYAATLMDACQSKGDIAGCREGVGSESEPGDCEIGHVSPSVSESGLTSEQRRIIMRVCSLFLHEFDSLYELWSAEGLDALIDEYSAHLCLRGQMIQMVNLSDQRIVSGRVQGVDDQGRLLLIGDDGLTRAVSSGEVTLL